MSALNIDLSKLNFAFRTRPLLIGGKAMEYYGLRKAGEDINFVITAGRLCSPCADVSGKF